MIAVLQTGDAIGLTQQLLDLGGWGACVLVVVLFLGGMYLGVLRWGKDCDKENTLWKEENVRLHETNQTLTAELSEERKRYRDELEEYRRRFWESQIRGGGE